MSTRTDVADAIQKTLKQRGGMLKNDLFQSIQPISQCSWGIFTDSLNQLIRDRRVQFFYSLVDTEE